MPEPIEFNLSGAQLPDNTIDFYTLLGESPSASTEELRLKIGAIYSEAQANRDHRNLKKRNEYKTLLDLLPAARVALLEAPKRARYDEFLAEARQGSAPLDFETFINDLMGFNEPMEENTGLLGVQDKPAEPRARVISTPSAPQSKPASGSKPAIQPKSVPANRPAASPANRPVAPSSSPTPQNPYASRPSSKSSGGNLAPVGAIAGFIVGALLGYLLLGHHLVPAILVGIVLAAIGFVVFNSNPNNKVKM